jgi:hypothetical protein
LIGYAGNDLIVKNAPDSSITYPITGIRSPNDPRVDKICFEVVPKLCSLGHAFYGRIVVQVGVAGSDWGYTGDVPFAWNLSCQRAALAFQACGAIVVDGHHVWQRLTKADPYHV